MATITRNDLATTLRDKFGFTAAQSGKLIDSIFDEICESLINGEEVKFAHRLSELKAELNKAIDEQNFERAAQIRDEIRAMEG